MSAKKRFYYLLEIQFLGFRLHGWQKQTNVKRTVQEMLEKTIKTALGHRDFKTLGASRTDAMVSANHHLVELYIYEELHVETVLHNININLPQDINVLKMTQIDSKFKIIDSDREKEYLYFFSFGKKAHPFAAPFLTNIIQDLDIDKMRIAAKVFEGEHNFYYFCHRPNEAKEFIRTISSSQIIPNTFYTGSFFPKDSFVLRVTGRGFLRHQIRIMMGALIRIGLGEIQLEELQENLTGNGEGPVGFIAPASGLLLNKININE